MRSRRSGVVWLFRKEWRELVGLRAWWALLFVIGPLVGLSFIDAVTSYAEVSAGAGAGCGAVCTPLIGIWGPTFGAYEIAAVFLLPFVAIRMVSGDVQSGALKIELQRPLAPFARVAIKALVVLAGWIVTGVAGVAALVLWASYGGHLAGPELIVVFAGHVLNGAVTIALAMAVASMTDHPSTAAIVTLAITIGTWVIDFAAALHGGVWEELAGYTPTAFVNLFQHGLVQVNAVLIALALAGAGLAASAVWVRLGVHARRRGWETAAVLATTGVVLAVAGLARGSWDASENRQNSFAEPVAEALEHLGAPLRIDVHLSAQDPRRLQFERGPLAKLRRAVPQLVVTHTARTESGLYEQSDRGYGEITYTLNGRSQASRVITDEGVVETILAVAGLTPDEEHEIADPGHPLIAQPAGAAWTFYAAWPAFVAAVGFLARRRG